MPEPAVALTVLYVGFLLVASRGLRKIDLASSSARGWIRAEADAFLRGMSLIVIGVAVFLLVAVSWRHHDALTDLLVLGIAFGGVAWELRRSVPTQH